VTNAEVKDSSTTSSSSLMQSFLFIPGMPDVQLSEHYKDHIVKTELITVSFIAKLESSIAAGRRIFQKQML
jgi:hypothetical protein